MLSEVKTTKMKPLILLFSIYSLICFSCSKKDDINPIAPALVGKWRMIQVEENATNLSLTKPTNISGEVEFIFSFTAESLGVINGNTPSNIFGATFTIGRNRSIQIQKTGITDAMETSWGNEFLNNIANSQDYFFETDNKLIIRTTNKVLTFLKL